MISLRLGLMAGGVAAAALLLLGLYWKGRLEGAAAERPKTEAAQTRAAAADLEVQGARETAARVDVVVRRSAAGAEVARDVALGATKSEDANVLLAPDRAARLHDADQRMCQLALLDGCEASDRDASASREAVPSAAIAAVSNHRRP